MPHSRPEEYNCNANCINSSPKKQPRVILSPESQSSRKRTRLEDQLSDIQYIDCNTPENIVSTTAVIHALPDSPKKERRLFDSYQPKNKSPRNSDNLENKRQSLNLESSPPKSSAMIPKSYTEMDISQKYLGPASIMTTPTPGSPGYKQLGESSSATTPGESPTYENYQKSSNNYENLLTTISITYKAPKSATTSPVKSPYTNMYENVIPNPEKAFVPTSTASLPIQEASQPHLLSDNNYTNIEERPKSLSALEELTVSSKESTVKPNLSSGAVCNTSERLSLGSLNDQKTLSSNMSSGSNIQYTPSICSAPYHCIDNSEHLSPTDTSLSEVVDNLTTSQTSVSFPLSLSKNSFSPNVSPTQLFGSSQDLLTTPDAKDVSEEALSTEDWLLDRPTSVNLIEFSPLEPPPGVLSSPSRLFNNDKRKSEETETQDENAVYQQVKYFRRSVHEVNALLDIGKEMASPQKQEGNTQENIYEDVRNDCNYDSLEPDNHIYEDVTNDSEDVYEKIEVHNNVKNGENLPNDNSTNHKVKKLYEKDSLPPCLRARNLKHQLKTRSLDEEQFENEFGGVRENQRRRISFDERVSGFSKTNSLPKMLNQPKSIPGADGKVETIHLGHSNENVNTVDDEQEEQKKRERIEKYKEERRKILQDKYR